MRAIARRGSVAAIALALACAHCSSDTAGGVSPGGGGVDAGGDGTTIGSPDQDGAAGADAAAPPADSGPGADAGDAAPVDPCLGRIVCDDFEKTAAGAKQGAPWVVEASSGTALVDETRAKSGKRSLKVSITATTASDTYRKAMIAVTGKPLIPLANDTVYGRFMIWTDRIPDKTVHWTFASGSGPVATLSAVYNYGGMGGLMANYYRNTTPDPNDCWQTKDQTFPTNAWTCVGFLLDGANAEMRFWLDGVEVPELHVVGMSKNDTTCTVKGVDGRWLPPTFDDVRVGWESYQNDVAGAHDAWIDDVILDDKPIPCP